MRKIMLGLVAGAFAATAAVGLMAAQAAPAPAPTPVHCTITADKPVVTSFPATVKFTWTSTGTGYLFVLPNAAYGGNVLNAQSGTMTITVRAPLNLQVIAATPYPYLPTGSAAWYCNATVSLAPAH